LQDGTDDCGEEWTMCVQTAKPCVEPQNDVDVEMEISKLKNGTANGLDQVPGELIQQGGKEFENVIYERIAK
jgi:hypothetical protein